jgi:hypothetical protein
MNFVQNWNKVVMNFLKSYPIPGQVGMCKRWDPQLTLESYNVPNAWPPWVIIQHYTSTIVKIPKSFGQLQNILNTWSQEYMVPEIKFNISEDKYSLEEASLTKRWWVWHAIPTQWSEVVNSLLIYHQLSIDRFKVVF